LLVQLIKIAFESIKHKWALTSMIAFLQKIYLDKYKFTDKQIAEIENILDALTSKGQKVLNTKRDVIDSKIKSTPLESYNKVSDARSERLIDNAEDVWAAKQTGLSRGGNHILN
jgi:hypothetical protein